MKKFTITQCKTTLYSFECAAFYKFTINHLYSILILSRLHMYTCISFKHYWWNTKRLHICNIEFHTFNGHILGLSHYSQTVQIGHIKLATGWLVSSVHECHINVLIRGEKYTTVSHVVMQAMTWLRYLKAILTDIEGDGCKGHRCRA